MKTISNAVRISVLAAMALITQSGFAQQMTGKPDEQKYQIRIVKEENGKQEIVEKTFTSKEELDAWEKQHQPEVLSRKGPGIIGPRPTGDSRVKKIVISENGEQSADGNTLLQIQYQNFSAEERAQVIQNLLNDKMKGVQIEMAKEQHEKGEIQEGNAVTAPGQSSEANNAAVEPKVNLTDVKVYPNPATGQFHLAFSVGKAANIQVTLSDMSGKQVYAESLSNYSGRFEKEINSGNLPAGTYIVNIQVGDEKRATEVVMQ